MKIKKKGDNWLVNDKPYNGPFICVVDEAIFNYRRGVISGRVTYVKSGFFRKGSIYHIKVSGVLGHFMLICSDDLPEIGTLSKGSINVGINYLLT